MKRTIVVASGVGVTIAASNVMIKRRSADFSTKIAA